MTEDEFYSISGHKDPHKFYLYYQEEPVSGYLREVNTPDGQSTEYRIHSKADYHKHRQHNTPLYELGIKVNLSSIKKWLPIENAASIPSQKDRIIRNYTYPKKLVILGAGASHDFTFDAAIRREQRPPLTMDIFDDRYDVILSGYAPARNLSSSILMHSSGVEDFFQTQWDRIRNHTDELLFRNLLNTQYYVYHLFRDVSRKHSFNRKNNYYNLSKLAREYSESKKEPVLFVSFNYDTLIEEALRNACEYRFDSIEDYADHENRKILLFKPHGSCNWSRRISPEFIQDETLRERTNNMSLLSSLIHQQGLDMSALSVIMGKDISIHPFDGQSVSDIYPDKLFFPNILLPYKDKDDFMMPEPHTRKLNTLLKDIEEVLIVGWKGSEAKFQRMLHTSLGHKELRIEVITQTSDSIRQNYADILPGTRRDDWAIHKGGFSKNFDKVSKFFML